VHYIADEGYAWSPDQMGEDEDDEGKDEDDPPAKELVEEVVG